MRKLIYTLTTAILLVASAGSASAAVDKAPVKKELTAEQEVQLQRIEQRVQEIKDMDKSNLSRTERKALKKELRDMNKQAAAITSGGIYLSVGALLIVILLLILLL